MHYSGGAIPDWDIDMAVLMQNLWTEFLSSEHRDLVTNKVRETAVTAAFWPFLKPLCEEGMVVTCDYDQMFDGAKVDAKKKTFYAGKTREIIPDILIHRVGKTDISDNLLVIEMKKISNKAWRKDFLKLEAMTSAPFPPRKFQYRFGVSLRYEPSGAFVAVLFQGGKQRSLQCPSFLCL